MFQSGDISKYRILNETINTFVGKLTDSNYNKKQEKIQLHQMTSIRKQLGIFNLADPKNERERLEFAIAKQKRAA